MVSVNYSHCSYLANHTLFVKLTKNKNPILQCYLQNRKSLFDTKKTRFFLREQHSFLSCRVPIQRLRCRLPLLLATNLLRVRNTFPGFRFL